MAKAYKRTGSIAGFMATNHGGLHHFHARKRTHQKLEPYPHPEKVKNFFDKSIFYVAILGPLFTIPQVLQIWLLKDASGVSLVSWSSYIAIAIFWLAYGCLHNERPIIIANILWLVFQVAIVAGTVIYG
jgi:uncharacterized protein with PQ loop repeat